MEPETNEEKKDDSKDSRSEEDAKLFESQLQLFSLLKGVIRQEKRLDALKEDLALASDFSVEAAMRLIDAENEGNVTGDQIADFLADAKPTAEDIEVLIRRYDTAKD